MSPWGHVQLNDVAFFQEGPGLRNWQWAEKGIKVINGRNILVDGNIDLGNTDKFITWEEFHSKYEHFEVQAGDIVVTSSGTLGKVGRIRSEHLPLMMNTSVIRFRPHDTSTLNDGFLFAYLRSSLFQEKVTAYAIGAAQPNFGPSHLKLISIPLPPISVQRRIAGILSAYDDLIEKSQRRIKILEEMARRLYREWFVHFCFPGHEGCRFVVSPLGEIPEGWEVKPFSGLAKYLNGFAFKPGDWGSSGKPIIKIRELKSGVSSDTPRNEGSEVPDKFLVVDGDILFSWSADLDAYLWSGGDGLLNQHLFNVLPIEGYTRYFCFHALKEAMPRFRALSLGATMHHIKRSALDQVFAVVPPAELRQRLDELVQPIHREIILLAKYVSNLRRTRDLLLPRLLSGQIDVEALPEPVPSEV